MAAKKPKKSDPVAPPVPAAPPDERDVVDEQFDDLESAMWDYLERTRDEGLEVLKRMVALVDKHPGLIDERSDMQRAAHAIKQAVEAVPTRESRVGDLLRLMELFENNDP